MEPLIDKRQVASLLDLSEWAVGELRRSGELHAVKLSSRKYKFRPEDVQSLIAKGLKLCSDESEQRNSE